MSRRYRRSTLSRVCGRAVLIVMRRGWHWPDVGRSMTVVGVMRRSVSAMIGQQPGRHVPEAQRILLMLFN